MLLLIEHLQLRGVHFAKCGAQLAAIKVLLDLAKLDRRRGGWRALRCVR
jgi:hypothetical protein